MDIDMDEPNIVRSGHSTKITQDGEAFQIEIYRLEGDQQWSLEVVDREGTSHVWDDLFDDDHAALDEAVSALREDGATAFKNPGNVVPFPRPSA